MKNLITLTLLVAACAMTHAAGERMHLVQPRGTELKLIQLQRQNDLFAKFAGQVWVTGTFVGRWSAGANNMADKSPDYLLVPDAASISKLPYFLLKEPPYFNSYKVKTIDLQNGEAALRIAVPEKDAKLLLGRKVDSVQTTGRFLVEAYVVGVECDAPWARAVLVKAELPEQAVAVHGKVPEGC